MPRTFADRTEAGRVLADELEARGITADIVLAIPRGGLPLGRAVADRLEVPLDVVVAKKLGAPFNPELAIGAAGSDGSVWLNDSLIDDLGIGEDYVETERERVIEAAREKAEQYRGEEPTPDLEGKAVVIVDDGVATGATITACANLARAAGADRVILAVPVGSPETIRDLESVADEVVVVDTPTFFQAVGQFYRQFDQVTDEEAIEYLSAADERVRDQ